MNLFSNFSPLLDAYDDGKPSRLKTWLKRIGTISFTASAISGAAVVGRGEAAYQDPSAIAQALLFIFPAGFIVGFLSFALLGIKYVGNNQGKQGIVGSVMLVLSKVFLYIILPSVLIAGAMVLLAYLMDGPMFQ